MIWVRVTAHYAPNVQLNLTVIEKRQKRRHFRILTNNQGAASYRYTEPQLSTQRTVMLKIWGVYAHHRRQVIVRYKI